MNEKNMDASIVATLYIKSKLLLNKIKDLSIKDMLSRIGLNVEKPFKVSFDDNNSASCLWLKYEADGRKVFFRFDEIRTKQDNKKILTIETLKDGIWESFGFFHADSKTNISKIHREQEKSIYLLDGNVVNPLANDLDVSDIDTKISIEEIIHSGINGPFGVTLKVGIYPIKGADAYTIVHPDFYLSFSITNWNEDSHYNLEHKSSDKANSFLESLICRFNSKSKCISIVDIYQEICNAYGLCVENMKENYQVNLYVSDYNKQQYILEEKDGVIEIREKGVVSKYVREVGNGVVGLKRSKGKDRRLS